ncbi:MAG: amidohydrolase family protein [SAR324 cluster bacterium]|nr:amidohydrolase family protein [SAR324 cluster bacterium]
MLKCIAAVSLLVFSVPVYAEQLPLIDAHIHYSHDAWTMLPAREAIAVLRKAGLKKAMVSSSSDDGTQKLFEEAPDLIVPVLRPYRQRGETGTWMNDDSIVDMIEQRLKRYRYAGIGEFHIFGDDANLPVMRRVVELAREYKLFLHAHSDQAAIEQIFKLDPEARVLWAHSGFDSPEEIAKLLAKYKRLWADLAFRSEHADGDKVDPEWEKLFLEFPDRILLGTDTFTPERWYYVVENAEQSRAWLQSLPRDLAENIAYKNAEALIRSGDFQ